MSIVYTDSDNYSNIADAIREKNGSEAGYTPSQMPAAILAIQSEPVIELLSVNENGTYTVPEGVDGYSPVNVNVSGGSGSDIVALADSIAILQAFGTQYSFTATISSGLCIVEVLHRKEITFSSGWTLLHKTVGNPNFVQYISVYYKTLQFPRTILGRIFRNQNRIKRK